MAAHLSHLAKHNIAEFAQRIDAYKLPADWRVMSDAINYADGTCRLRRPTAAYATTKEFDICLRKDLSDEALQYFFAEGPQATFWYKLPTGTISRIVESFLERLVETAFRPIFCVCDHRTPEPTLLWQELYVDFFPSERFQWSPVKPISFYDLCPTK